MNQIAGKGFDKWEVNVTQSILGKAFLPFGLADGQIFTEYDLIYVYNDMLFWGARNVDGRGFDTEENRPTNLQIPLVRVIWGLNRRKIFCSVPENLPKLDQ